MRVDGSLENLLAGLESSFDATIARDEEIAATDLARSLDRGADLRHRLGRAAGTVLLLLQGSRLPVASVGADYCTCGEPPSVLAPLHRAALVLTGAGSPPSDTSTTLTQALARWADRSARVEIDTATGRHAGTLEQACADHLVVDMGEGRILVPMPIVGSIRLSHAG